MMSRRTRIYVAGPYTRPDPAANTNRAIEVGNRLWDAGYAPFIPHLTHLWHLVTPKPYEEWLELDIEWLRACDALLRFPGESSGADKEIVFARQNNIPVYFTEAKLFAAELARRDA